MRRGARRKIIGFSVDHGLDLLLYNIIFVIPIGVITIIIRNPFVNIRMRDEIGYIILRSGFVLHVHTIRHTNHDVTAFSSFRAIAFRK